MKNTPYIVPKRDLMNSCDRLNQKEWESTGYKIDIFIRENRYNERLCENSLVKKIESLESLKTIKDFLQKQSSMSKAIKLPYEFKITIAYSTNICTKNQISDICIASAVVAGFNDYLKCSNCAACVEACNENAITLLENWQEPVIDSSKCTNCGECIKACGTGFLREEMCGYKIYLGGSMECQRHLGIELPGIYSEDEVVGIVDKTIEFYKENSENGERLGVLLNRLGFNGKALKKILFK